MGETGELPPEEHPPLPDLLAELVDRPEEEALTLGEVADVVRGRGHGLALLVLAIPETIPMVGLSAILGLPILVLGLLLLFQGPDPPIPAWIRHRSIPAGKLRSALRRTRFLWKAVDRVSRPRWPLLARAGRLHGAVCVAMALLLAFPTPGANIVAAGAVAATGVGILQRDGMAIALGATLAVLAALAFALTATGAWMLLSRFLGG